MSTPEERCRGPNCGWAVCPDHGLEGCPQPEPTGEPEAVSDAERIAAAEEVLGRDHFECFESGGTRTPDLSLADAQKLLNALVLVCRERDDARREVAERPTPEGRKWQCGGCGHFCVTEGDEARFCGWCGIDLWGGKGDTRPPPEGLREEVDKLVADTNAFTERGSLKAAILALVQRRAQPVINSALVERLREALYRETGFTFESEALYAALLATFNSENNDAK